MPDQQQPQGDAVQPLIFEKFGGINTATTRPGVPDEQAYWLDGFMPLAPRNLRTLWGAGPNLYSAAGNTILFFNFYNIGNTAYLVVFLTDGSANQVDTTTGNVTPILPTSTITSPGTDTTGTSQYGQKYLIIVTKQDNGYWLWDGSTLYGAGSIAPQVTMTNVGSGYTSQPSISLSGGSGSGATFTAVIENQEIVNILVTNAGSGYQPGDTPTVSISGGGGSAATATVALMPFGVSGTAVETYQGHVWVINDGVCQFSAPGSTFDFSTADGGGSFQSSDSFLKVAYIALVQTNGFLFFVGDSSMNYISGVQVSTSGDVTTTTFTNNNSDPEVGTPYAASVTTLGQDIFVANSAGVFVSNGGVFVKKSEALDGVYNTGTFGGFPLSAAKATIFGKRVWMVLVPITDPVSGLPVNKLFMYNGKVWWASEQNRQLSFIAGQEINSVYTAWGTEGTNIFTMFTNPSPDFTKIIQTKLWDEPHGYEFGKAVGRFWSLWQCNVVDNAAISLEVAAVGISPVDGSQYTNHMTYSITGPTGLGFFVTPPQAVGQQGVLTGFGLTTTASDYTLISAKLGAVETQGRF